MEVRERRKSSDECESDTVCSFQGMDYSVDKSFTFSIDSIYIIYYISFIFLDSSMVEHSAVNRVVVGSSPTRGA